jgi:acylphosphatase
MIAKRVDYTGRVQGVGFRYTARSIASGHAVAGYVRNLPSGEVELWAEGERDEVERFLAALARQMAGYIVSHREHEETPQGFPDFTVRA